MAKEIVKKKNPVIHKYIVRKYFLLLQNTLSSGIVKAIIIGNAIIRILCTEPESIPVKYRTTNKITKNTQKKRNNGSFCFFCNKETKDKKNIKYSTYCFTCKVEAMLGNKKKKAKSTMYFKDILETTHHKNHDSLIYPRDKHFHSDVPQKTSIFAFQTFYY